VLHQALPTSGLCVGWDAGRTERVAVVGCGDRRVSVLAHARNRHPLRSPAAERFVRWVVGSSCEYLRLRSESSERHELIWMATQDYGTCRSGARRELTVHCVDLQQSDVRGGYSGGFIHSPFERVLRYALYLEVTAPKHFQVRTWTIKYSNLWIGNFHCVTLRWQTERIIYEGYRFLGGGRGRTCGSSACLCVLATTCRSGARPWTRCPPRSPAARHGTKRYTDPPNIVLYTAQLLEMCT
jgi:hypothetical protein